MLSSKQLIEEIDAALQMHDQYRSAAKYDDLSDLKREKQSELMTCLAATIERVAPSGSVYRKQTESAFAQYGRDNSYMFPILAGVLRALRADYVAGRLRTITEAIHADLFTDFLEMAEHLHGEGYKDAAAVIAGSVLEEHLRKLAQKHDISLQVNERPKKADALNSELAAAGAYSKLTQKNVTAWLGLRNSAAHGHYAEYSKESVTIFLQALGDFFQQHAA